MSASLENQFISDRYTSLLHLSGSSITAVLDSVHDGLGNATPIQISDARVVIGAGSSIIDVNEDEASVSINNIQLPTASTATTLYDVIFPVNSIYLTATNINPSNSFSGTVWELVSEGRYLAGVGTGSDKNGEQATIRAGSNLDTVGEYKHTLTESEMPKHKHGFSGADDPTPKGGSQSISPFVITRDDPEQRILPGEPGNQDFASAGKSGAEGETGIFAAGGSQSHNNAPPYFGVYVWKRTS
jgi:hypothetical protein